MKRGAENWKHHESNRWHCQCERARDVRSSNQNQIWHKGVSLFFSDEETSKREKDHTRSKEATSSSTSCTTMHESGINIEGWLPCVTLYTLKTCWQRLHPSAKARKKRAQLDMLNTSSRHGWRRTWGGRSSSLPRPPKATETKGEGQERWGNSERSDSGIELLCIFFDFPFKHLEWIEY